MKCGRMKDKRNFNFKLQNAIGYLMTYGWAILIIGLVIVALYLFGFFNPQTTIPSSTSILWTNWQYMKPIIINNTNNRNTLSDYQILITLDTASLISQGKMRSDCGDIRFKDSDGSTLLNYWIESGCNSANTKIWVKVPSIPASSTKTIYLYYGNPSAASVSSGSSTFLVFNLKSDGPISGKVDMGGWHTCIILDNGSVKCWGRNDYGQLGDGTTTDKYTPVVVNGLSNVVAIATSTYHSCALLSDGTVKCWGRNDRGELGDGVISLYESTPVVVNRLSNVVAISTGGYHTCALLSDGTVKCWGANDRGQLGDGTLEDKSTPVTVKGLSNAIAIASGDLHTCALLGDGTVKCWGGNYFGQLGDGTNVSKSTPITVNGLTNAVAISAGGYHTCALLSDGTVKCWGRNDRGELGDGKVVSYESTPVTVIGLSNVIEISTGVAHTCALLNDGTVKCWGNNADGQLGDGTTTPSSVPVTVNGLSNVIMITTGGWHTCALFNDGTIKCWGDNYFGQLGDGTQNDSPIPVIAKNCNIGGVYDKTNGILTLQKPSQIDTYFIRAYTSPEPTVSVGVEQIV
jgi:alpha-tubulin suppressor-like RCC1 family protein